MATRTYTEPLYNMFVLVFFLLAQTGCDWVEISQNHYRKENQKLETDNMNYEESTQAILVYRNNSLLEHWKKGVIDRVPGVANIRRVYVPSVKTTSMQTENNIFTRQASTHMNAEDESYESIITKPNILSKYNEEEIPMDPSERIEAPYHINRGSSFERNSEALSFHKAHIENTNKLSKIESVNKGYVTNVNKENLNQKIESFKSTYLKGSENNGIITTNRTPQIKNLDERKVDFNYEGGGVIKEQLLSKNSTLKGFPNIVDQIVKSVPINYPIREKMEIDPEDKTRGAQSTHFKNLNESEKHKKSNEEASIINTDGIFNNSQGSTVNSMWKLVRVVADSIYKSTRKSFRSKINYLEGLKSNILSSIEDQVERTWPDDRARSSRRVREAEGRGHVDFPSSESALMSISFLTFAVFLIKLVLQVIHTYKNKTMMVTPAVVTAVGRAATAMKSNQQ